MKQCLFIHFSFILLILSHSANTLASEVNKETLGQRLFFDPVLSLSKTQSCASCHDPSSAFVDKRVNVSKGAGSLGHSGEFIGDRNTPTATYANQTPLFHINKKGEYVGGMFWDGREADLKAQAGGPPLNPIEMAMPNKVLIAQRLKQDSEYQKSFKAIFGDQIFDSADAVYEALKESIAAFENTDFFSPFDSKYDRYLNGDYKLTEQEEFGMTLFFSKQFTNCNECHLLNKRPLAANETFTDYRYHNIGVPKNTLLRLVNQSKPDYVDIGLLNNPSVTDKQHMGKFKTPTLRNIAVTAPYMHNGVFQKLETVIAFYNQYNSKNPKNKINPETGNTWAKPEISENIALEELKKGSALDEKRIDALVAFLKLLTDKRYESQL
jgi:cytochrome c peroxidase